VLKDFQRFTIRLPTDPNHPITFIVIRCISTTLPTTA